MVLPMMKRICNFYKKYKAFPITLLLIFTPLFCEETKNEFVIGAKSFSFSKGSTLNSVTSGISQMFPVTILENISSNQYRITAPNEEFDKINYELKKQRLSYYLQLSNEYKKKDAYTLESHSDIEYRSLINESEKKIKALKKQIDQNLEQLKKEETKLEKNSLSFEKNVEQKIKGSEKGKYSFMIKNFFSDNNTSLVQENISFYKNDPSSLVSIPSSLESESPLSWKFEEEMMNNKINALITGTISNYGSYISVTVDLYMYPGAKKIATVTEVGTIQEATLISLNLARSLIPSLLNAMPVKINISYTKTTDKPSFYIDDINQNGIPSSIILDSGVHHLEFSCAGYKKVGVSYYFEGNKSYNIDVNFEPLSYSLVNIELLKPMLGKIYVNNENPVELVDNKASIKINGKSILGQFIDINGESAFFYIDSKYVQENTNAIIKLNIEDKDELIKKRRRWMYASYSALITSLIPAMYTYGNALVYVNAYKGNYGDLATARSWQTAAYVCMGVSISCGVFFVYELIRYFIAADSPLPKKAKINYVTDNNVDNTIDENNDIEIKEE